MGTEGEEKTTLHNSPGLTSREPKPPAGGQPGTTGPLLPVASVAGKVSAVLAGQLPYLILTLPQQLLLAQIVDSQQLPHTDQHPPLEGGNSRRHLLHRRLDAREEQALRR